MRIKKNYSSEFWHKSRRILGLLVTIWSFFSLSLVDAQSIENKEFLTCGYQQDTNPIKTDPVWEGIASEFQCCHSIPIADIEWYSPRHSKFNSFFGIKTNLFYWAGITPELKRRDFIPNAELEWYFNRHWSMNVDGTYVYLHNHHADQEQWGVSSIAIEPRFWVNGDNCFTGIYVGIYGLIGQFDVRLNRISEKGHTGDFQEGGISLGYYLPLSLRWGIEAGGQFGYRTVSGDIYRYVYPKHFYYDSSYSQNGLKLTGIRLLLTCRLGRFKKQE